MKSSKKTTAVFGCVLIAAVAIIAASYAHHPFNSTAALPTPKINTESKKVLQSNSQPKNDSIENNCPFKAKQREMSADEIKRYNKKYDKLIYPIGEEVFAYELNSEENVSNQTIIKEYSIKVLNGKMFSNHLPKGITKREIGFISPCADNIRDKIVDDNGNILEGWKFLQLQVEVTNLLNRTKEWPGGRLYLEVYNPNIRIKSNDHFDRVECPYLKGGVAKRKYNPLIKAHQSKVFSVGYLLQPDKVWDVEEEKTHSGADYYLVCNTETASIHTGTKESFIDLNPIIKGAEEKKDE